MEEKKTLSVKIDYASTLNYAMFENRIPFIRSVILMHSMEEDLKNVTVTFSFQEEFAKGIVKELDILPKGLEVDLGKIPVELNGEMLFRMTEAMTLSMTIAVNRKDEVLFKESHEIRVLAYNEWQGYDTMPEMLAAFVTPNHPSIDNILIEASNLLKDSGKDPSLEGYQKGDINRVREQVSAIYTALMNRFITYIGPPQSFSGQGQRIRLSSEVLEKKMGTCLDTTVLFASCLEAVSLNPILILIKGHSFIGFWQEEQFFPDMVDYDFASITKRTAMGMNLIGVLETTGICDGVSLSYLESERQAMAHLSRPDDFIMAVDVKRARAGKIKPIPERLLKDGSYIRIEDKRLEERAKDMPELISIVRMDLGKEEAKVDKRTQWERKLLDLSMRNNLLNFVRGKKGIELLVKDSRTLEDLLDKGEEYEVLSKIVDHEGKDREISLLTASDYLIEYGSLIEEELSQKRIRTITPEKELSAKMTKLYRDAKVYIEESGTNCLFLSLGLLKWYENDFTEKERYAPILLVPVELSKRVGKIAYKVKGREEETLINVTLLEKLKQDFGIEIKGLDPVPMDEYGVDVIKIYSIIRSAIINQKKWDVVESVNLGIFSFSKFIMWNDIKNHGDDLKRNKVISSLMEGRLTFIPHEMDDDKRLLDDSIDPRELLLPVSTDASQMLAVEAAKKGNSFVLHGPPGTGKSQTITTIIANALYDGKKVLFVAEKMAALSVVQRRLEALGLGYFSLEVHSNKSKKTTILKKLDETIRLSSSNNINFKEEADKLDVVRKDLNSIVKTLYKEYGFGLCAYELIGILGSLEKTPVMSNLMGIDYETLTAEEFEKICLLGRELSSVVKETGDYANTPLKGIGVREYAFTLKGEVEVLLDLLIPKADALGEKLEEVSDKLGVKEIETKYKTDALFGLLVLLKECPTPVEVLSSRNFSLAGNLNDLAGKVRERNERKGSLLEKYDNGLLDADTRELRKAFMEAETRFILMKNIAQKKILKGIMSFAKGPLEKEGLLPLFDEIEELKRLEEEIRKNFREHSELISLDHGADTQEDILKRAASDLDKVNGLMERFDIEDRNAIKEWISQKDSMSENLDSEGFMAARGGFEELFEKLREILALQVEVLPGLEGNWGYRFSDRLKTYRNNLDYLREWTNYNNLKEKAINMRVPELTEDFEQGTLDGRDAENIIHRALSQGAFAHILDHEELLNKVTGRQVEDKVGYFKEVTRKYEELSKRQIFYKLASKIPNMMKEANSSSEVGILQRAIRGNGRGTTIRSLFERLPNLLPRITPCMLMSPLSVAQYLGTNKESFDLVIFDEASQLPTAEAVGAMARGTEVVIVGDPKQLPPTTFFSANITEEEDSTLEDLDNILEDALALSMPESSLLWHYRSRHESLIAFSNKTYYENNLYTYPSPKEMTSKVSYEFVEATYGRGGTRANKKEADAVVREIMDRLKDEKRKNDSIGVVTFSQAQKDLIEDTLAEALREYPEIEEMILNMEEPVFVKNLENVQGDERDVILFSIGYGPDEFGKLTLNFGPLNRENGWKRLNVAITRSKKEMKIFTSVKPEMIDTSKTSSKGLHDLRGFLEYARRGSLAIDAREAELRSKEDSLSHVIRMALEDKGLKVDTNIGSSKYKVDMGIVDPRNADEYLLGILCQGESYKNARCARDRDILQESVLKGLGWNLIHIYPMDWVENKEREIERIETKVREILSGEDKGETKKGESGNLIRGMGQNNEPQEITGEVQNPETGLGRNYTEARFTLKPISSEEFRMPKNTRNIRDVLEEIIRVEAPISVNLLTKKALKAFGVRSTPNNKELIDNVLSNLSYEILEEQGTFFVFRNGAAGAINAYRTNEKDCKRDAADIPRGEIELAIKDTVHKQVSIPRDSLIEEVQKLFNFSKGNADIRDKISAILDSMEMDEVRLDETGSYISLK